MFSPTSRRSLRMPMSPIEKQAFRSRSFRKILLSACALFLSVTTIHRLGRQQEFSSGLVQDYRLSFHPNNLFYGRLSSARIEDSQWQSAKPKKKKKDDDDEESHHRLQHMIHELPEVIRIPFEEAVQDVDLEGWEDEWFSTGTYDTSKHGNLKEPKIDFVYNWVNGSEDGFKDIRHKYEVASPLNDKKGDWISKHSINRYRDWDELRYSFRSLEKYASNFTNKVQLLVNSVSYSKDNKTKSLRPQSPHWLKDDKATQESVQVLSQEDFFGETEKECLPSFDSLSIEAQIYNTPSKVDQMVALSDDMFLGADHSAADFYSPLFGSVIGFKHSHYNVKNVKESEIPTFGEKPHLYYTSWLLNHRFGERDRKVQAHFTHSISRRLMKEAMESFPSPALRGACERFRGESRFQIYPWFTAFHYSIERFREALLWSFVMSRSDVNSDGYLDWSERQGMLDAIRPGRKLLKGEDSSTPVMTAEGRDRMFYRLPSILKQAGLKPPLSNINVLWTSIDGPETIRDVKCNGFHINKCFAESFDSPASDATYRNPDFTAADIFSQLARREPKCGDCVIKFLLSATPRGLEPLLPPKSKVHEREVAIKAMVKYQHTVIEPDAMFVMIKDAEQAEAELLDRSIRRDKKVSQWCLNDDVMTEDEGSVQQVNEVIQTVFRTLFPEKCKWER